MGSFIYSTILGVTFLVLILVIFMVKNLIIACDYRPSHLRLVDIIHWVIDECHGGGSLLLSIFYWPLKVPCKYIAQASRHEIGHLLGIYFVSTKYMEALRFTAGVNVRWISTWSTGAFAMVHIHSPQKAAQLDKLAFLLFCCGGYASDRTMGDKGMRQLMDSRGDIMLWRREAKKQLGMSGTEAKEAWHLGVKIMINFMAKNKALYEGSILKLQSNLFMGHEEVMVLMGHLEHCAANDELIDQVNLLLKIEG